MPTPEGHALIEELDDDEQVREVFARYGVAVYQAQVLEHGLVNLLMVAEKANGKIPSPQAYDERIERLFTKTLGDLVRRHKAADRLASEDLDLCYRAVKQRNWLAHQYFRAHAEDFMTPTGRQRMLEEADEARRLFTEADAASDRLVFEIGKVLGITPDVVEAEAARMRIELDQQEGASEGN